MCHFASLFAAVFLCLATPGHADQFHRLFVTLNRVPTDVADLRVNVSVLWGANMPPADRPPDWLEPVSVNVSGGRRSSAIDLDQLRFQGPDEVRSALVYGTITDGATGEVVRVLPASVVDLTADANDTVRFALTTEPDFPAAFRASYPFVFLRDRGFVNDETVRPTLVAVRYFIEEAGRNNYRLSEEEWGRIRSFFLFNTTYFGDGGAEHVLEILNYFQGVSGSTEDIRFHRFYAEFLNAVLGRIADRMVNSQSLHSIVVEYLNTLYANRLADTFEQSDLTLQTLEDRGYYLKCIDISRTVLAEMNRGFLETVGAPLNLRSVLGMSNRCGQLYYKLDTGETDGDLRGAAQYLAGFGLGESMMKNFVRVLQDMDDLGQLRVTNHSDSLLGDYFRAYSEVLGGQG